MSTLTDLLQDRPLRCVIVGLDNRCMCAPASLFFHALLSSPACYARLCAWLEYFTLLIEGAPLLALSPAPLFLQGSMLIVRAVARALFCMCWLQAERSRPFHRCVSLCLLRVVSLCSTQSILRTQRTFAVMVVGENGKLHRQCLIASRRRSARTTKS